MSKQCHCEWIEASWGMKWMWCEHFRGHECASSHWHKKALLIEQCERRVYCQSSFNSVPNYTVTFNDSVWVFGPHQKEVNLICCASNQQDKPVRCRPFVIYDQMNLKPEINKKSQPCSHLRLMCCVGSRLLLLLQMAVACWGAGFCLLCRQASMTAQTQVWFYRHWFAEADLQNEEKCNG